MSTLRQVIHVCLSIVLHGYYEKADQGDHSFFYENHIKEKYDYRKDKKTKICYVNVMFNVGIDGIFSDTSVKITSGNEGAAIYQSMTNAEFLS